MYTCEAFLCCPRSSKRVSSALGGPRPGSAEALNAFPSGHNISSVGQPRTCPAPSWTFVQPHRPAGVHGNDFPAHPRITVPQRFVVHTQHGRFALFVLAFLTLSCFTRSIVPFARATFVVSQVGARQSALDLGAALGLFVVLHPLSRAACALFWR